MTIPMNSTSNFKLRGWIVGCHLVLGVSSCFIGELEGADCIRDSDCLGYLCLDGQCREPAKVTSVAVGSRNTCVVVDGTARCWGDNRDYQLGDPALLEAPDQRCWPDPNRSAVKSTKAVRKISIASTNHPHYPLHACAVFEPGGVACWGKGNYASQDLAGWLGQGDALDVHAPFDVPNVKDDSNNEILALDTSVSELYSCSILMGTRGLACWGARTKHLGTENSMNVGGGPPAPLHVTVDFGAPIDQVSSIATGINHACAILTDGGSTWCWGATVYGAVGVSPCGAPQCSTPDHNPPFDTDFVTEVPVLAHTTAARSVGVGQYHTCIIQTDDTVYCWGSNAEGQLGLGVAASAVLPAGSCRPDLNNAFTECSLEPVEAYAVNSIEGRPLRITTGSNHNCTLTDAGDVYCWGDNYYGQLGHVSLQSSSTPLLVEFPQGTEIEDVVCAGDHCCAQDTQGMLFCWGDNSYGQLGRGPSVSCNKSGGVSRVSLTRKTN